MLTLKSKLFQSTVSNYNKVCLHVKLYLGLYYVHNNCMYAEEVGHDFLLMHTCHRL